ncbi:MAG: flagellar hook capping family protein [Alphaproteobacteria bacterium]|nr:flagellar hook capping family protein [Alphaproteobacteria bacterium]
MTSVSTSTLSSLVSGTDNAKKKAADTYNQFLTLLTTQLQHQDPLDPMQSEEFTNQLVQFSQVEQAILGNEKMDTLLSQVNNNQIGQSLSYIGKDVYYNGSTIHYEGEPLKIGYAVDGEVNSAKLRIVDENNQIIRTLDLKQGSKNGNMEWDGKDEFGNLAPSGKNYTVRVDALDADNKALKSYTGVPAHVTGVETLSGVLYLALNGDRRIEAANVLSVSQPDQEVPAT